MWLRYLGRGHYPMVLDVKAINIDAFEEENGKYRNKGQLDDY